MNWERENLFIDWKKYLFKTISSGEMFAGILEWPQIWPHAQWGMASKVNIYYFKVGGIIM